MIQTSVAEEGKGSPEDELLRAVAEELIGEIHMVYAPFKRRLIMMKKGELDMMCGLLRRPEREAYIHFIDPPYKTRSDTIFFVQKDSGRRIESYEDLKGLKIGVVRGLKYFLQFDRDTTLVTEAADQTTTNFKKLLLGRLDTMVQSESHGIHIIHKMGIAQEVDIADFRFSEEKKVYFGISRHSWMMKSLDLIEAILKKMIDSGRVRQIYTEYYTSRGLPAPAM